MRVLGFDLEATDLDTATARITEVGAVLWDVPARVPLMISNHLCWGEDYPSVFTPEVSAMVERVCKFTPAMLTEFGGDPKEVLQNLENMARNGGAQYIVAHNGEGYDKPLLLAELDRHGVEAPYLRSLPWIDTRTDLPFVTEPDSRKLKHLAGDHGFINPFSHRAVFDVLTMMRIFGHYDIREIIEHQSIPFVTLRALVSYDNRQMAKDQRFSWEKVGDKTYPKMWVKRVKANKLEEEKKACKFPIAQLDN
jgi:DNA polymerase-3 subunit epsilon